MNPNETSGSWKTSKRDAVVQLYLSNVDAGAGELLDARPAGYPTSIVMISAEDWIEPDGLLGAVAAVIQVDPGNAGSIKRFQQLAATVKTPLIAAAYEPPLALVRSLIRAGAHDVLPLPISMEELEIALGPIKEQLAKVQNEADASTGQLVSVIKSVGGVGATSLLTQLAIRFSQSEKPAGRDACLIDLDLQFGDAAFQLGLQPKLSLLDLLQAGTRLDGDLLRATTTDHPSGMQILAAPADMIPIEGIPTDHLLRIIELAKREFDTVFVDLPTNWTNWSLSVVAQSNLVLLITEQTVAGISRAKRQLGLLQSQDLADLDLRVIINRYDKGLARTVRPADIRTALGREVAYTVANDFALMRGAVDRGVPISELKRKSALGKDIDALDAGIAAALGLER